MTFPRIRSWSAFLAIKIVSLLPILTYISIITSWLTPTCFLQFTHKTMQVFLVSAMRPPSYSVEIQQEASLMFPISILFFFEKNTAVRFFYPCPQHHHCHGHSRPHFTVTTTASNSASAHISHGSQRNPSLVQLTSTVSQCKRSLRMSLVWTAQVSVCPSHAKNASSAGAHFTNTHAPRSSYQKDEQFPLQDKSSNKFSDAAYSFVQNWTTASALPSANSKLCLQCLQLQIWCVKQTLLHSCQ